MTIQHRKDEHIELVLKRNVTSRNLTTGFENYRFLHCALPEINFSDISLTATFLGKKLKAPLLISSMTGGTKRTGEINKNMALAAEERGWAMGLGSMRVALEYPESRSTFQVRKYAPTIPIFANLGAVQLNYGYGMDHCRQIVELAEADALVLHLNSLQEVFQPEGNTRFAGLLKKIERLCNKLEIPIGVKEVGWGIDGKLAEQLISIGVSFIDVAGAGGTSWSQVEKYRTSHPLLKQAAESFSDWGIPTAECMMDVKRRVPYALLIASGGLSSGIDAAKAIALGARLAGYGRSLLKSAVEPTPEHIINHLTLIELELKIAMFGIGVSDIQGLQKTDRLIPSLRGD
ncbi:type 2 isopentenyl-diphosphate Delta-isomerase [Thermoflavimicrobium dichotomicum]|uniref:Isopentenyl-diphosphate delta-isomerase n=1 Tax=Thermoflavimicrobium dichotomicum TaxID=46223 RepID=A0A1I3S6H7_9BACL|nr:type 2 isopentenyl-diphosphate Delta-isomerase [Thermoflavimicrobium dichotomicum]SFJ54248.1 isopentenyl-diphosphate delta-isomerase [Thermoflavimicrobium dichotomicum]